MINEVRAAVYAHFLAMAPSYTVLPANLDSIPQGGRLALSAEETPRPDDEALWMRLILLHTGREQVSLGALGKRRYRNQATIFASVFVPLQLPGGPVPTADEAMDALKAIFSGRRIYGTGVVLLTRTATPRENVPDGPWFPVTVETPATYDELA